MAVTIFGDSILKGVLLENGCYTINKQWDERLESAMGQKLENRSRFGCTISKALSVITRDCKKNERPGDVVFLEFGGNDCDYRWEEVDAQPDTGHDCKTPPEEFVTDYQQAVQLVRESGRTPVLMTLPPIHSERYLRFICRNGLSPERILHWLGDVEAISRWQEKYSNLVEQVAKQESVRLIDLRGGFLKNKKRLDDLLCADGIHPSRDGQQLIYETLCGSLA